jgi:hypothetical protein
MTSKILTIQMHWSLPIMIIILNITQLIQKKLQQRKIQNQTEIRMIRVNQINSQM